MRPDAKLPDEIEVTPLPMPVVEEASEETEEDTNEEETAEEVKEEKANLKKKKLRKKKSKKKVMINDFEKTFRIKRNAT